jgi:uncharacterized protein
MEFIQTSPVLLEEAQKKAQDTFKFFWRELSWEARRIVKGVGLAVVKFLLENEQGEKDHVWVKDIQFDGKYICGLLVNKPFFICDVEVGDPMGFELTDVEDWVLACGGKVCGGFTIQVIRAGMSEAERAQHDAIWGLPFGDVNDKIMVTPSVAYDGAETVSLLERSEHPMCLNMIPQVEQMIAQYPTVVSDVDDDGFTMLQREAIAGNASVVKLLCEAGADPYLTTTTTVTVEGEEVEETVQCAYEFSKKMIWPVIVENIGEP